MHKRTCDATEDESSKRRLVDVVPDYILQRTSTTQLDLGSQRLTFLHSVIYNLSNLTYLSLSHNQLSSLPSGIGDFFTGKKQMGIK